MFRARNATCTVSGISAGVKTGSSTSETAISVRYAANQGAACRVPANVSAPRGHISAHSATPLDGMNPPSDHCRAKGSASMSESFIVRKTR
jgi:hypothetical protein